MLSKAETPESVLLKGEKKKMLYKALSGIMADHRRALMLRKTLEEMGIDDAL